LTNVNYCLIFDSLGGELTYSDSRYSISLQYVDPSLVKSRGGSVESLEESEFCVSFLCNFPASFILKVSSNFYIGTR